MIAKDIGRPEINPAFLSGDRRLHRERKSDDAVAQPDMYVMLKLEF